MTTDDDCCQIHFATPSWAPKLTILISTAKFTNPRSPDSDSCDVFSVDMVEVRGRVSTLNGSERNRQKLDAKHTCMEKETPSRKNWKIRRDLVGGSQG